MKNVFTFIGAITVAIGVVAAAAIIVKKYADKMAEKKRAEDEGFYECDGNCCCDLGFDDEEDINWEDIPVEEDEEDIIAESIKELDDLDIDGGEDK